MTAIIQLALFYLLVYFLINGLDDLSIDLRVARGWLRRNRGSWLRNRRPLLGKLPTLGELQRAPAQRIAILVPLWNESAIIETMVNENLERIEYLAYDFFLGVYPNDHKTMAAALRLQAAHKQVHVSVCSRPGPTSKADCLNHIYRFVEHFEKDNGLRFPVVMLHDAEDALHPVSLLLVNWFSAAYAMVQVPVLPMATPLSEWVHGIYCDEFAEFLNRDLRLREIEGAFLPSNGVGTAFCRHAIDVLCARQDGVLFDEECLTEDYEIGLKLHQAGCSQILLPLTRQYGGILATREYFPNTLKEAKRQRTRWISGQCLQSWERNGWPLQWGLSYWFWRDRKGIVGNFLNPLALVLLLVGTAAIVAPEFTGLGPWLWVAGSIPGAGILYLACTILSLERLAVRFVLVGSVYGWRFASGVPIRMAVGCWLNAVATASALRGFAVARWKRKRLGWLKTEHTVAASVPALSNGKVAFGEHEPTHHQAPLVMAASTGAHAHGQYTMAVSPSMSPPHATSPPEATAWTDRALVARLQPMTLPDGEIVLLVPPSLSPVQRQALLSRRVVRIVTFDGQSPEAPQQPSEPQEKLP